MLIDWFTVAAQLLNFLILVWLLKRFLYRPILDAIDARERRVAEELAQADATRDKARAEQAHYREQREALEAQRSALLAQATADAEAERQRLIETARQNAAEQDARRARQLASQAQALQLALAGRAQDEVFAICRKALGDLADAELEAQMVAMLVRRLRAADDEEVSALVQAFEDASAPLTVRSAFVLSEVDRSTLQEALQAVLGIAQPPRFETAPDLVAGIEIAAGGQTLGWSIADYLASLQTGVGEVLASQSAPPSDARPAASEDPAHAG